MNERRTRLLRSLFVLQLFLTAFQSAVATLSAPPVEDLLETLAGGILYGLLILRSGSRKLSESQGKHLI